MVDRDELISALLSGYREELASLTDEELLHHFKLQGAMRDMSPEEWERAARGKV